MKVLHIAETALGGVGTYLAEVLPTQERLLGLGNVRALLPDRHRNHVSGVDRRTIATWRRGGRSGGAVLMLAAAIRREVADFAPTIIHAHSTVAGCVVRALYGWWRPFRIVYCAHGWAFDRAGSFLKNRLIERLEAALSLRADRVVVISEHERRAALRIGIAEDRLALVLNGIADRPAAFPARWDEQRLKVLFVGRLDAQKGIDTLLDAVAPLRDQVSLRVIGKAVAGPWVARTGSDAQVEYLGWRSLAEVATEIAAADVIAIPSRWEGFGLVALEAMRAGRAVIASDVGGLGEVVVDRVTGRLVPPDSPERLMRAMTAHDRAAWAAMGRAGRARYKALFTAERMNNELLALYRTLDDTSSVVSNRLLPVHA